LADFVFSSDFAVGNHIGNAQSIGQHISGGAFLAGLFIVSLEAVGNESDGFAESGRRGEESLDTTGESI